MPRGVYNREAKEVKGSGISMMNKEELDQVEKKAEGKKSPLPPIEGNKMEPVAGTHRVRVGGFTKPALVGHAGTLKDFAKIEIDHEAEGWVPMSWEQMNDYQDKGLLAGWDGDKQLGLIGKSKPKRGIK